MGKATMNLNLPVLDQLSRCRNLLIAGMGGGYDIFCGLPLYFELRRHKHRVHLANFSYSPIVKLQGGIRLSETLVGVTAKVESLSPYFPELHLARWFRETRREEVTVWCFERTGVRPLLANYRHLMKHLSLDGILLIDGGVDSLIRGDETQTGSVAGDAVSLAVVNELQTIATRLIGCVGLGAERQITYAHILENIAALTKAGGFLGACALTPQMEAYQLYEEAVLYVQSKQEASAINSSIISAVHGHFGNYHLTVKTQRHPLWISPLMPLYWFFSAPIVAQHNQLLTHLSQTESFREAFDATWKAIQTIPKREPNSIPLS